MKKQLFISAFVMALGTAGFAQQSGIADRQPVQKNNLQHWQGDKIRQINQMFPTAGYFAPTSKSGVQRPTQIQSRLQNAFNQIYDGTGYTTLDSNIYFYSNPINQSGIDSIFLNLLGVPFSDVTLYEPNNRQPQQDVKSDSSKSYNIGGEADMEQLTFDANGNIIGYLYVVDTGAGFQNSNRGEFTYDAQSNVTSLYAQYWDGTSWQNDYAFLFSYNSNEKMIGEVQLNGNGTAWDSFSRWVFNYDAQSNFTGQVTDMWNTSTSSWDAYSRYVETWSNGYRTSEERDTWDGTQWVGDYKDEYTYDANNRIASNTHNIWEDSAWNKTIRYNYTHDAAGHYTQQIYQGWSGNDWVDSTKQDNVFDGNLQTKVIYSYWDGDSSAFQNYFQFTYTYNSYDQCTSVTSASNWDGSQFTPVPNADIRYVFRYEDYDDGLGIGQHSENPEFQLYPNPARNQITVSVSQGSINRIRIVDLTGKVVFSSKAKTNAAQITLPVSQLSDGIYFLQVQTGNQTGSRALIIKH